MKVKDILKSTKYKTYEVVLLKNEEGTKMAIPRRNLLKENEIYILYGEYEVLSIKDYQDTKTTSVLLKDY